MQDQKEQFDKSVAQIGNPGDRSPDDVELKAQIEGLMNQSGVMREMQARMQEDLSGKTNELTNLLEQLKEQNEDLHKARVTVIQRDAMLDLQMKYVSQLSAEK